MRKTSELREKSVEELRAAYLEMSKEIFDKMNELQKTRKMEKSHRIRHCKKERARILTILSEKGEALV